MSEKRNLVSIIVQGKDLTSNELDAVSARMDKLGRTLQRVGTVAIGAGIAIAAGLAAATKAAGDLEEGIVNALTLIDLQADQFESMKGSMTELAFDMSRKLNVAAKDVALGFYQVLSTGAEQGSKGFQLLTETALKLTKVTGLVLPQSVERLAGVVSAFNLDLEENVERIADVAFMGTRLALTDLPQLTDAYKDAAPAAAAVGQSIETTTAVLLVMADGMIKGQRAGTSFRIILNRLAQSEGTAADELHRLKVEAFDSEGNMRNLIDVLDDLKVVTDAMTAKQRLATLTTIAGEEAFSKLAQILGAGTEKLREYEKALSIQGALQSAFDTKMKGFNERWLRLTLEVKNAALAIGTQLMPTVAGFIDQIADIVGGLTDWIRANENLATGIAVVAAALVGGGGLVVAIGTTIRIINVLKVTSLVAFGTGGLITIAILATLGAVVTLVDVFRNLRGELDTLQDFDVGIKLTGEEVNTVTRLRKALREGVTKTIPGGPGKEPIDFKVKMSPEAQKKASDTIFEILDRGRERFQEGEIIDAAKVKEEIIAIERAIKEAEAEFRFGGDPLPRLTGRARLRIVSAGFAGETPPPLRIPVDLTPLEAEEVGRTLEEAFADEIEGMTRIANDAGFAIASAFTSGFGEIEEGATIMSTVLKNTFKNLADVIIAEINRMIAKWIAMKIIIGSLDFLTGGAFSAASAVFPASAASDFVGPPAPESFRHGGTIRGTGVGFDTVIGRLGRGETVIDSTTTNKLADFLDGKGQRGAGSMVLEQHFHQVVLAGSEQEAVEFGRISTEEQRAFEGLFLSNKRANG